MNDKVKMNREPITEKVAWNESDLRHLAKLIDGISVRLAAVEKIVNAKSAVVYGHTSEMPDYKGENRDHDARYATKGFVKSSIDNIDPVTVADTDSVDMSIDGQEVSAETIGLTDTITFTSDK